MERWLRGSTFTASLQLGFFSSVASGCALSGCNTLCNPCSAGSAEFSLCFSALCLVFVFFVSELSSLLFCPSIIWSLVSVAWSHLSLLFREALCFRAVFDPCFPNLCSLSAPSLSHLSTPLTDVQTSTALNAQSDSGCLGPSVLSFTFTHSSFASSLSSLFSAFSGLLCTG